MRLFKTWHLLVALVSIIAVAIIIKYAIFLLVVIVGILGWRAARYIWMK